MLLPALAEVGPIAVVGCGGLGVPGAWTLAALGAAELVLIDADAVELSNLHRQILYDTVSVGTAKTEALAAALTARYPGLVVHRRTGHVDANSVAALLAGSHTVLECSDDSLAKFCVNDWLVADRKRTGVIAAAIGARGQWMAVTGTTACYRCLFEAPPPADSVATCRVAGVIGTTVGLIGSLAARALAAALCGAPDPAVGALVRWGNRGVLRTEVGRAADCICAGVA